jgi:DNA-binding MarR family transcriptional regulator
MSASAGISSATQSEKMGQYTSEKSRQHRRGPLTPRRAVTVPSSANSVGRGSAKSLLAVAVLQHIRELFRVSQQHFQRIESRCGVSGAQLWALAELQARPGSKISELASALSVHLSTASNLLDRLEAKSLVRRQRGKQDQRIVRVYLTAVGQKVLRKAPKPAEGIIPDALHRMSRDALGRLERDLEKLLQLARMRDRRAAMKPLADL